jgi:hypothetical protein
MTSRTTASAFSLDLSTFTVELEVLLARRFLEPNMHYTILYPSPFSVATGLVGLRAILTVVRWWVT